MNILTIDIEEWFHLLEFAGTKNEAQWNKFESRIHNNVDRILHILDESNNKATFFVVGWVAKRYPEIVKKIAQKYEIGSHSMNHQLVWQQDRQEFKKDLEESIKILQDTTGQAVKYFRAPGFSIRKDEPWAFEILGELGIEIDCSVFPAIHAHGGIPDYPTHKQSIIEHNGVRIKEFPITTKKIFRKNVAFSGGGYFRITPYGLIKRWTQQNSDYNLCYIHPRDLDGDQPMIPGLPITRKFKSYVGIKHAEEKFRHYMKDFKFIDIKTADEMTDWDNVPIIKL